MYGKDLTGIKFGKLTVIKRAETIKKIGSTYICLCECGNRKTIARSSLTRSYGSSKSCGCVISTQHTDESKPRLSSAKVVFRDYNDGDISFEYFLTISQQNCHYCGASPSNSRNRFVNDKKKYASDFAIKHGTFIYNGLDRKNNSQPHNKENLVPCCWICNNAKGTRSLREFKAWIRKVYAHIESKR